MSEEEHKKVSSPQSDISAGKESKGTGPHFMPLEKDDTLIKRPKTLPISEQPNVEPTIRWGNVFLGESTRLILRLRTRSEPFTVEVQDGRYVIGRVQSHSTDQPDLDLTRYGAYFHGVSRRHAAIIKDGNVLQIEDLRSTNGTYLNGRRLLPHQPRMLRDGDELCLGHLVMRVFYSNPDTAPLA